MFEKSKKFIFGKSFLTNASLFEFAVGWVLVGVIGRLFTSLIEDIVMPVIGRITGNIDFSDFFMALNRFVTASDLEQAREQGPVLAYGQFLTILINSLLIAAIILPIMFWLNRKHIHLSDDGRKSQ
jgi:large conductance mechanosensitive channel